MNIKHLLNRLIGLADDSFFERKKIIMKYFLFTFVLVGSSSGNRPLHYFLREAGWNVGHRETVYFKFGAYLKSSL